MIVGVTATVSATVIPIAIATVIPTVIAVVIPTVIPVVGMSVNEEIAKKRIDVPSRPCGRQRKQKERPERLFAMQWMQ